MTGLRSRLEAVEGVDSIELDLGADGLEGITVRLADGADEVAVLEGIRRLLVAYGTKTPREPIDAGPRAVATEVTGDTHLVIDLDAVQDDLASGRESPGGATEATMVTTEGEAVALSVRPAGNQSAALVHLTWAGRSSRRQVPASPRAIVQAVIDIASELRGRPPISVIGMNLSEIGATRLLTVIVGNHGSVPRVCTATVVDRDWPQALLSILQQVVGEPSLRA